MNRSEEASPYTPWPESGCTLQEALDRTADPDLRIAAGDAERKLAAAGGRRRRHLPFQLADARNEDKEFCGQMPEEHPRQQFERVADAAQDALTSTFYRNLVQGDLIATGSRGRPSEEPSLIQTKTWNDLKVRDWTRSIAAERTEEKISWYGVRVFPPLLAPSVTGLIARLPFREVFRRFVLEDREVRALAKAALRTDRHAKPMLEEGKFGHDVSFEYEWPVELGEFEDFAKVVVASRYHFERPKSAGRDCRTACASLRHRYGRLLYLCIRLGLRGTIPSTGSIVDIDPVHLSRPAAWIDVRNGDLLEKTIDGKFFPRWTGLSFLEGDRPDHGADSFPIGAPRPITDPSIGPVSTFHVKCTAPDGVRRDTIEPRPTSMKKSIVRIERDQAIVQACAGWLVQIMRASKNERSHSKQTLWNEAQERWPGSLSHRSFLGAWTEAIRISGAIVWGAPGAPRKSARKSAR